MKKLFFCLFLILNICFRIEAIELTHSKTEYKQAVKQYNKFIKEYPQKWELYYGRGLLFYEQGKDYTEYVYKNFQKASKLNPESEELKWNYLIIKEFRDARLKYALKVAAAGGIIGGVVAGEIPYNTMPKLKDIDINPWDMLEELNAKCATPITNTDKLE